MVLGGDSGIRSAAILFAKEGARGVTITYLPQEKEDAESAKKQIEESGEVAVVHLHVGIDVLTDPLALS